MDNKVNDVLENVSARIDTISKIMTGLYSIFDGEIDSREYRELYDWHVANYDLVKNLLWELSCSLSDQAEIIDGLIIEKR